MISTVRALDKVAPKIESINLKGKMKNTFLKSKLILTEMNWPNMASRNIKIMAAIKLNLTLLLFLSN